MKKLNLSWLRKARRDGHLTLMQAAHSIGKDRSTMWRYESGEIPLTIDTLLRLLDVYGVSLSDVIEKEESD